MWGGGDGKQGRQGEVSQNNFSAEAVGVLTNDEHVFTKTAGPRLKRTHLSGILGPV